MLNGPRADDLADRLRAARELRPETTNRSTPREMTRPLAAVWFDEAGPAAACAAVRRVMGLPSVGRGLRSGFGPGVDVASRIGSVASIRDEVGVVGYPDGGRYAVAVFTRSRSYVRPRPAADAAIGAAARVAVEHVRAT